MDLSPAARRLLGPGETVQWVGRPDPTVWWTGRILALTVLLATGVTVGILLVLTPADAAGVALIVLTLAASAMIVLFERANYRRIRYGLTTRRLILETGRNLEIVEPRHITTVRIQRGILDSILDRDTSSVYVHTADEGTRPGPAPRRALDHLMDAVGFQVLLQGLIPGPAATRPRIAATTQRAPAAKRPSTPRTPVPRTMARTSPRPAPPRRPRTSR